MDLGLSLPKPVESRKSEIEIRPGRLTTWLESLPVLNLVDTSFRIHQALAATNRTRIDDKTRLKLLEIYRQPISTVCEALEKEFIGNSLPLSTKALQSANRARDLQIEMATGYKILAQNMSESLNGKARDKVKAQIAMIVQRAIFHLAASIYHSYISYRPAIPGAWKEIHRLFEFALHYESATIEVEDALQPVDGKSSAARIYKKAILIDLSGPYHLPGLSIQNINQCLDKWGDLASLNIASGLPKDSCQFLITKERDSSGEVYNGNAIEPGNLRKYLMLNTLELARHVHTRLKSLQAGDTPREEGIRGGVFTEANSRELLGKLINAWGVNPKRNFRRVSRKGDTIDVALGVEAVSFWLNGGETLTLSSEFVGPMPQKRKTGTLYMQAADESERAEIASAELERNPGLRHFQWGVIDDSAGGLAVTTDQPGKQRTKVGDIAAIRGKADNQWEVAAIRWIKTGTGGEVSIGLQRLAPHAVAVAINVTNEDEEGTEFKPAILLPQMPALKQAASLVVEKSVVSVGDRFIIDNGYQRSEAESTRTVEATSAFERFEFTAHQVRQ